VHFSSGGFGVRYGDKMSSVLDVRYKRPDSTSGGANINLLGMSAHAEGAANDGKLTWLAGFRHKTNRYLLGTLDTKGDYNPSFRDAQVFFSYQVNPKLTVDMLGYYALNKYHFIPSDRETTFGTMSDVKQLKIYFAGQEKDHFETGMGGIRFQYESDNGSQYEWLASHYRAFEEETFDIAGAYWLQEIQAFDDSEPATNLGVGEYLKHARNDLLATISKFSMEGEHPAGANSHLNWGVEWRSEHFSDRINEWEMNDSAGYSVPRNPELKLDYSRQADFDMRTQHFKGFITHRTSFRNSWSRIRLNYGTRLMYSDREKRLYVTPRFQVALLPLATPDTRFRISGGWYYQPPFYKEYRPPQTGNVKNVETQKSRQILAGVDHYFSIFDRPFQFTSEAYYKYFSDLIPYQVDNVRILYSGHNEAKGFATGIDFKLHGEFVPGTESWATLSLLRTMEDLENDTWDKPGEPGYIPRPSDQRLNFSMFFQDYLPNNPTFKVNLSLFYGTGLPFGPPRSPRYMATHRMPPYRRVDVGFSKDLLPLLNQKSYNRLIKDFWLGLEVFNLFDISNTISYYWVSDVENRQYAVPNYLTGRRINVSLNVEF
ncbi:MAG: TonB-dependent receptor, partial [Bacteroidota bacterium]